MNITINSSHKNNLNNFNILHYPIRRAGVQNFCHLMLSMLSNETAFCIHFNECVHFRTDLFDSGCGFRIWSRWGQLLNLKVANVAKGSHASEASNVCPGSFWVFSA